MPQRRSPTDQLAIMRKGADRLVISEENYIGGLNTPLRKVKQVRYPEAASRMTALAQAMQVPGIDVLLAVRHPAAFLNSAYCQLLMGGRIMPLARYQQINPLQSVDWCDLVQRLRAAPGVNRLIVWRYEDYADVFDQICSGLVGVGAADLVRPLERRIHVGLSEAAVAEVHMLFDRRDTGRAAIEARKKYPVEKGHPPFDGYSAGVHDAATQDYAAQIKAIAGLDGVTLLHP